MINVSREFKEAMKTRTDFTETAEITFADGRVLSLTQSDFTVSGNGITDGAGSSSFPLGVAVEKSVRVELMNADDHLSDYDFQGAVIRLKLNFALESRTETINYGTYTVVTPETYGSTVQIEAVDDMYKADVAFSTRYSFPATLGDIVREACTTLGITLGTPTFPNDDFEVKEKPEDLTYREFFAMAAMIAGGYARMNYAGRLEIKAFDLSLFEQADSLDGGIFDANNPYASGDVADGGSFAPWDTGYQADAGTFAGMEGSHVFYNFSTLTVETDDVVITGIQYEDADGNVILSGNEGYVLAIENDLITGQEQDALDLIGKAIIGLRFRPFSADHIAYPLAEFGDLAYIIDRKGNVFQTVLTDIDFSFFGLTELSCSADSPIRNSSKYASNLTKAVVTARKNTQKQISAYDVEVQRFAAMAANSMGLYETREVQDDGSIIYYQHDKPTLVESMNIWKRTADVFAVSNDGGKTWRGMDADGNVLATVLSVIGVKAEWIETAKLIVNHLQSFGANYSLESKEGRVDLYHGDYRRMSLALYFLKGDEFNYDNTFGNLQIWKGKVNKDGVLLDNNARYAYLTAESMSIGENKKGTPHFQVWDNGSVDMAGDFKIVNKSTNNPSFYVWNDGDVSFNGARLNGISNWWIANKNKNPQIWMDNGENSNAIEFVYESTGDKRTILRGVVHGTCYLGVSSLRWNTLYCFSVDQSSDRKLKTDIAPIDKATAFLMSLEPVQYRMKDGKRIHFGFIAQDVAAAAAENNMGDLSMYKAAVIGAEEEQYYSPDIPDEQLSWGLDYSQIIAPLVQTVQDQQKRIESLEARLAALEKMIGG